MDEITWEPVDMAGPMRELFDRFRTRYPQVPAKYDNATDTFRVADEFEVRPNPVVPGIFCVDPPGRSRVNSHFTASVRAFGVVERIGDACEHLAYRVGAREHPSHEPD